MHIIAIIPARYASSRFPAKVLADIKGKTMIRRVYEQTKKARHIAEVYVATDHEAIAAEVQNFGGKCVMTSPNHQSGTDRCFEALTQIQAMSNQKIDYVINVQGDEPFIQPDQIDRIAETLIARKRKGEEKIELATMILKVQSVEDLANNSEVFVTFNTIKEALYFSRFPIPYQQKVPKEKWLDTHTYYKHVGIYAYMAEVLEEITATSPSTLEKCESLEQLRWLEHGYTIQLVETETDSYCIDTPEDLERVLKMF